MSFIEFSKISIEANQKGYITGEQEKKLYQDQSRALLLLAFTSIFCCIPVGFSIKEFLQNDISLNTIMFFVIPIIIFIAITHLVFYRWRMVEKDLRMGQLAYVEGRVMIGIKNTRSLQYKITINGLAFDISDDLHKAITHGAKYGIYFTPNSFVILSIRRFRSDDLDPTLIEPRD